MGMTGDLRRLTASEAFGLDRARGRRGTAAENVPEVMV